MAEFAQYIERLLGDEVSAEQSNHVGVSVCVSFFLVIFTRVHAVMDLSIYFS